MYTIKFKRFGCRNKIFFRIISSDTDGSAKKVKYLGYFCPKSNNLNIDIKTVLFLINNGAKLTKSLFSKIKEQYPEINLSMVK